MYYKIMGKLSLFHSSHVRIMHGHCEANLKIMYNDNNNYSSICTVTINSKRI